MNLLQDYQGDSSSGILMMIITFIAATLIANLGVFIGIDLSQLTLLTGAFLVPTIGGQIGQALQKRSNPSPDIDNSGENKVEGVNTQEGANDGSATPSQPRARSSLGVFHSPYGYMDTGRILKVLSVFVAIELAIVIILVSKNGGIAGASELCGAFITYATASEFTQKVGGI